MDARFQFGSVWVGPWVRVYGCVPGTQERSGVSSLRLKKIIFHRLKWKIDQNASNERYDGMVRALSHSKMQLKTVLQWKWRTAQILVQTNEIANCCWNKRLEHELSPRNAHSISLGRRCPWHNPMRWNLYVAHQIGIEHARKKNEVQVKGKDECDFDSFGSMCVWRRGKKNGNSYGFSTTPAIRFKFFFVFVFQSSKKSNEKKVIRWRWHQTTSMSDGFSLTFFHNEYVNTSKLENHFKGKTFASFFSLSVFSLLKEKHS